MRISPSTASPSINPPLPSEIKKPLQNAPSQLPPAKRVHKWLLAYWKKEGYQIFVHFDPASCRTWATAYRGEQEVQVKVALAQKVTAAHFIQAQRTLAQMKVSLSYQNGILVVKPKLGLKGGGDEAIRSIRDLATSQRDETLALEALDAFESARSEQLAELVELARFESTQVVMGVLTALLRPLQEETLFNPRLLHALARALTYTDSRFVRAENLVDILRYLHGRIDQLSIADEGRLLDELRALSSLLDAMVAADVKGLDRVEVHKLLMQQLDAVIDACKKEESRQHHLFLAKSCREALVRIPSDETKIHRQLRRLLHAGEGASLLAEAWGEKSIGSVVGAFQEFYKALKPDRKAKAWYDTFQFAQILILQGRYEQAKEVLTELKEKYRPRVCYLLSQNVEMLSSEESARLHQIVPEISIERVATLPPAGDALFHKVRSTLSWRLHTLHTARCAAADASFYIPLTASSHLHTSEDLDPEEEVHTFLQSDKRVLLILGEAGSGKSTLIEKVEHDLWKKGKIPLLIPLSGIDPHNAEFVKEALHRHRFTEEQSEELLSKPEVTLLFDGYEEMANSPLINLHTFGALHRFPHAKIVIVCRKERLFRVENWEHYFAPFDDDAPNLDALTTLYLAPFSANQVESYLRHHASAYPVEGWDVERYRERIKKMPSLRSLLTTPFNLHMVCTILPTLPESEDLTLTRRGLYAAFTKFWIERELEKVHQTGHLVPPLIDDATEECLDYCRDLAKEMARRGITEVPYDPVSFLPIEEEASSLWERFFGIDPIASFLRRLAPVVPTSNGWRFRHATLSDHFATDRSEEITPFESGEKIEWKKPRTLHDERYVIHEVSSTEQLVERLTTATLTPFEHNALLQLARDTLFSLPDTPKPAELEEIIPLAEIADRDFLHAFLEKLLALIKRDVITDVAYVEALSRSVARMPKEHLDATNLLLCIDIIIDKLSLLHKVKAERAQLQLLCALESLVLALLDTEVCIEKEQAEACIQALSKSAHPQISAVRSCLKQALRRLETTEDRLSSYLEKGQYIGKGVASLIEGVGRYSPKKVIEGLREFKKACKRKGKQHVWYDELRTALLIIRTQDVIGFQQLDLQLKAQHRDYPLYILLRALNDAITSTTDEGKRAAWADQLLAFAKRGDEMLQRAARSLFEEYAFYPACEMRAVVAQAKEELPVPAEPWILTYSDAISPTTTLLQAGKKSLSWRIAEIESAMRNDALLLAEEKLYTPLKVAKRVTDPPEEHESLMEGIQHFLDAEERVLLFKGDSGSGKSLSMRWLAVELWKNRTDERLLPLVISLTGVARTDRRIVQRALEKQGITDALFSQLQERYRLLLILDGGDEMHGAEGSNLITANYLLEKAWKVIITCRTQFLEKKEAHRAYFLPHLTPHRELTTLPFRQDQIKSYFESFCAHTDTPWTPQLYLETLKRFPRLREMIANPFALRILAEVLPAIIEKDAADLDELSSVNVYFYEAFVRQWLERQHDKLIRGASKKLSERELEGYYDYAIRLATAMQKADVTEIVYSPPRRGEVDTSPWAPFFSTKREETVRARIACPLTFSRSGRELTCRFFHLSLLEYLAGQSVHRKKHENPLAILYARLFVRDAGMLRFWVEDAEESAVFRTKLLEIIERSKESDEEKIAAANAITILVAAGHSFSQADLRGIQVPEAVLDGGIFYGADLSGANLEGCSFHEICFSQTNLDRANLVGVDWGERRPYFKHYKNPEQITLVALSPDESQLLMGDAHGTLMMHAFPSGEKLWEMKSNWDVRVIAAQFLGESIYVATYGEWCGNGITDIAEITQQGLVHRIKDEIVRPEFFIKNIAFHPTRTEWAYFSDEAEIRVFDLETKTKKQKVNSETEPEMFRGFDTALTYAQNGVYLAAGWESGGVEIWNCANSCEPYELVSYLEHDDGLDVMLFNDNSTRLITGGNDSVVRVWVVPSGHLLFQLAAHIGQITALAFQAESNILVSGGEDKMVHLWNPQTGALIATLNHKAKISSLISCSNHRLISKSQDGEVRVWNTKRTLLKKTQPRFQPQNVKTVEWEEKPLFLWGEHDRYPGEVYHAQFNHDGLKVALVKDVSIIIFDTQTHTQLKIIDVTNPNPPYQGIFSLAWSHDSKKMAIHTSEGKGIWDVETGKKVWFQDRDEEIRPNELIISRLTKGLSQTIAFNRDDSSVVVSFPGPLLFYNASDGKCLGTGDLPSTRCVAFSPDGNLMITSTDSKIVGYDVSRGNPLQGKFLFHEFLAGIIHKLQFLSNELILIGTQGSGCIFSLKSRSVQLYLGSVCDFDAYPNSEWIAVAVDSDIKFVNMKTAQSITRHQQKIPASLIRDPVVSDKMGESDIYMLSHDSSLDSPRLVMPIADETHPGSQENAADLDLSSDDSGSEFSQETAAGGPRTREVFTHNPSINSIACNPNGKEIIIRRDNEFVCVNTNFPNFNLSTIDIPVQRIHVAEILSITYCADFKMIASSSLQRSLVLICDAESSATLFTLTSYRASAITALATDPSGLILAEGGDFGVVVIWDIRTKEVLLTRTVSSVCSRVTSLAFNQDASHLAIGYSHSVFLLDIAANEILTVFSVEEGCTQGFPVWSEDGAQLAVIDKRGTTHVWDVASGEENFCTADWIQDPSVNCDKTMKIEMEGDLPKEICTLEGEIIHSFNESVVKAIWNRDGRHMVTGGKNGELNLWEIDFEARKAKLLWRTHHHLVAEGVSIKEAQGLTSAHQQLLRQLGAEEEVVPSSLERKSCSIL